MTSLNYPFGPPPKEKLGRPAVLAAYAILNVRLLERALAGVDLARLDKQFDETADVVRRSLSVAPSDPFLWAVYFWVENNRLGFKAKHLDYLRMSYLTGPNEGWVSMNRNRFALAIYAALPDDLKDEAVSEFGHLIGSGFYDAAVDTLSRQSGELVDRLLGSLRLVKLDDRENFGKIAYKQGYDWNVPGVEKPEWRPWH